MIEEDLGADIYPNYWPSISYILDFSFDPNQPGPVFQDSGSMSGGNFINDRFFIPFPTVTCLRGTS